MSIPNCTTAGHEWRYRQGEEPECKHCLRGSLDIIDNLTAERGRLREALADARESVANAVSESASAILRLDDGYKNNTMSIVQERAYEDMDAAHCNARSALRALDAALSTPAPGEPAPVVPAHEKATCATCEGRRFVCKPFQHLPNDWHACYLGERCMYERKPCPDCAGGKAEGSR